jgi:Fe-Mn family superoxide dismutase
MKLHHSKHHAAYVNNLNIAEEKLKEAQAKSKRDFISLNF